MIAIDDGDESGSARASSPPLYIIFNRGSGGEDSEKRERIMREVLTRAERPHALFVTGDPRELEALAHRAIDLAQRNRGAIVVAGGDGTINAIANRVLPHRLPFGILAQGTFNFTGRCHGIPENTQRAVEALLEAGIKPIQVGMLNGRAFLVNASLGLYPQLLHDREGFKQRLGRRRAVAIVSGVVSLLRHYRELALHVDSDGERRQLHTATLVVVNNRLQLEKIGIDRAAALESGELIAIVIEPRNAAALFWLALRGMTGSLGEAGGESDFAFRKMEVRPRGAFRRRHILVALDGELIRMRFPLRFSVAPEALRLMVPADARRERA
ncbi:MAG TPA: diacylglycerol kinase family protein [Gammaproteobacteria bacterium]|nr:diacylglycerol kinase family protein [Gammaproteobacteria bacterium]